MYLDLSTRFALKTHTWPTTVAQIYLSLISLINHVGMFLFEKRAKLTHTYYAKQQSKMNRFSFGSIFVFVSSCCYYVCQSIYSLLKSSIFVVFTFNDFYSILIAATSFHFNFQRIFSTDEEKDNDKRIKANQTKIPYTHTIAVYVGATVPNSNTEPKLYRSKMVQKTRLKSFWKYFFFCAQYIMALRHYNSFCCRISI